MQDTAYLMVGDNLPSGDGIVLVNVRRWSPYATVVMQMARRIGAYLLEKWAVFVEAEVAGVRRSVAETDWRTDRQPHIGQRQEEDGWQAL